MVSGIDRASSDARDVAVYCIRQESGPIHGGKDRQFLGRGADGQRFDTGGRPSSVAVADLNLDSIPDLAVATRSNYVSVLLGSGDGTFQADQRFAAGKSPVSVAVADLNLTASPMW